jgi:hypothetical protein
MAYPGGLYRWRDHWRGKPANGSNGPTRAGKAGSSRVLYKERWTNIQPKDDDTRNSIIRIRVFKGTHKALGRWEARGGGSPGHSEQHYSPSASSQASTEEPVKVHRQPSHAVAWLLYRLARSQQAAHRIAARGTSPF